MPEIHFPGSVSRVSRRPTKDEARLQHGSRQRNGNYVLAVTNIIRNLSTITDNVPYIAQHQRLLDLMLRVRGANYDGSRPRTTSPTLSLSGLVTVRKDALQILRNVVNQINLASQVRRYPIFSAAGLPHNEVSDTCHLPLPIVQGDKLRRVEKRKILIILLCSADRSTNCASIGSSEEANERRP